MKLSYSAVWNDVMAMLRPNVAVLAAIAGAFLFLPALLLGHFLPPRDPDPARPLAGMIEHIGANWPWHLLANIVNMAGAIAMLLLLLDRGGRTVGNAIGAAVLILPFYFLASLLSMLIVGVGLVLLIVPGLYLYGRLAVIGPVVVAEGLRNPINAVRRSFEVTRSNGWRVLGLVVLIALAGVIVSYALTAVLGTVFYLLAGQDTGRLLVLILNSLAAAALSTLLLVLSAAIYRALAATGPSTSGT